MKSKYINLEYDLTNSAFRKEVKEAAAVDTSKINETIKFASIKLKVV